MPRKVAFAQAQACAAGGRSFRASGLWGGWVGPIDEDATTFTSEHPYDILILTISMADGKHKALVWRGQATVESHLRRQARATLVL
jgi:hypothetical protein